MPVSDVYVYVYKINLPQMASSGGNSSAHEGLPLPQPNIGVYYSSIIVHAKEIEYTPDQGVVIKNLDENRNTPFDRHYLGSTEISLEDIEKKVNSLRCSFRANNYNRLINNCIHFSEELGYSLTGSHLPKYLKNQETVGKSALLGLGVGATLLLPPLAAPVALVARLGTFIAGLTFGNQ